MNNPTVSNLPCPDCGAAVVLDGLYIACPAGHRSGVFVRADGVVSLRKGGRKFTGRVKKPVATRMYDDVRAGVEARGWTVQSLLDDAAARVLAEPVEGRAMIDAVLQQMSEIDQEHSNSRLCWGLLKDWLEQQKAAHQSKEG